MSRQTRVYHFQSTSFALSQGSMNDERRMLVECLRSPVRQLMQSKFNELDDKVRMVGDGRRRCGVTRTADNASLSHTD